jgi:hypothetical protein
MAITRYFVEAGKFASLQGSELMSDADLTTRKLVGRTVLSEAIVLHNPRSTG